MPPATVSAAFAKGLIELAVVRGADRRTLETRSGVASIDQQPGARMPLAKFLAVLRASQALSGDPALGLRFGEAISLGSFAGLGLGGLRGGATPDCLGQLGRHLAMMADVDLAWGSDRFEVAARRGGIWLVDRRAEPNEAPELSEITFALLLGWSRRDGGPDWVKAVEFTHAEPDHRAEYERIFQVPVRFGAPENALLIGDVLTEKQAGADRSPVEARAWEAVLLEIEGASPTRAKVETLLLPMLHTGGARVELIAERMGMSRHTLFRRLRAEGVTFEKVLDDLRRRMAHHYLDAQGASLKEAAHLLGFSEPAALSRAYKRWVGRSRGRRRRA